MSKAAPCRCDRPEEGHLVEHADGRREALCARCNGEIMQNSNDEESHTIRYPAGLHWPYNIIPFNITLALLLLMLLAFSVGAGQGTTDIKALLRDQPPHANWTYALDDAAYEFVGMLSGRPSIAVVDFDDIHGQLVTGITKRAIAGATVRLYDVHKWWKSLHCTELGLFGSVACAHIAIARATEEALRDAPHVISFSLGFLRSPISRFMAPKPCANNEYPPSLYFEEFKRILEEAHERGIYITSSAGNYGYTHYLGFPSCLGFVYSSVALARKTVYNARVLSIASYSNLVQHPLALASPIGGIAIDPGGDEYEGTSFSAPMLAAIIGSAYSKCRFVNLSKTKHVVTEEVWEKFFSVNVPIAEDINNTIC